MINPEHRVVLTRGGTLDFDHYREKALAERSAAMRSYTPTLSRAARRRFGQAGLAFALATGAFWAIILTDPPQTEAAAPAGVMELMRIAPLDLSILAPDPI